MSDFKVKMKVVYTKINQSEMTDEDFEKWELETSIITENVTKKEIEQFKKEIDSNQFFGIDWTEEDIVIEIANSRLGLYEDYEVLEVKKRGFNYGL